MKVLITAGNTAIPIDQVRIISNVFKGMTGTAIARYFANKWQQVTLITSNPQLLTAADRRLFDIISYRTYQQLAQIMERKIINGNYDVIIHSAAVSDYQTAGVFVKARYGDLIPVDASNKIASTHPALYLKLVPTEKLIDKIRQPWGFNGILVKFKLQVGITDKELLSIAAKSGYS
jgi:phosphopantothenoylcysteine synthetase/decarboxylase